jgi:hypothetical protein
MNDRDDTGDAVEQLFGRSPHMAKSDGRPTPRPPAARAPAPPPARGKEPESDEEACAAFGYLRGLQDRALEVEFRRRDGTSEAYPYSCLASRRFDPSVGLLLKYTADVVTLVLICGSNLDMPVKGTVNLTDRGFQRHRITWVREMDEDELRRVGDSGPTIDAIHIAAFETAKEQHDWLKKMAPAFLRTPA